MPAIQDKTTLYNIDGLTILPIPPSISEKLPSRGIVMVAGQINGVPFADVLEPDGSRGHFLEVDDSQQKKIGARAGDTIEISVEPTEEWVEPEVPEDVKKALAKAPVAHALWTKITPAARWDWVRWIRATKQAETRARRIDVAISKLTAGTRRPCCFNRAQCTLPSVSNNGVLLKKT